MWKLGTGNNVIKNPHGFTLIELLVVVFILGVAASLITVRLAGKDRGYSQVVGAFSNRVHHTFLYTQEQAILQSNQIGIRFEDAKMTFWKLSVENESSEQFWEPMPKGMGFKDNAIPEDLRILVSGESLGDNAPQVIFFSSGDLLPFEMEIVDKNQKGYRINGESNGAIVLEAL